MPLDKRTREQMLAHCGEIHEDDGTDPREFFKASRIHKKDDRKTKQLCRQVAETLDQVLSGEISDDVLRGLRVSGVVPAPDASRLLVTLYADCDPEGFDRDTIEQQLAVRHGQLRYEIAASITRKKTPTLVFNVIGPDCTSNEKSNEVQQ
ncbi:ribosome-binding factor A [Adhaeretor mobilis]|uniref:Ribosome-binding factor A n=1 Tax=Adhaeretor mobilis TaxID=1930276 RepID=A0A517MWG0_9BACT|nr:ribosome-binding factor A [Adhaeretor mobilis]QDS99215.1 ribosome-binding factor A [Adhaeretor mobilis]